MSVNNPGGGGGLASLAASMPYIVDLPENHGAKRNGVTDDTAAIQAAINSAVAACIANSSFYCEVWFSSGIYRVAGPLVQGGTTFGNSQITLPVVAAGTSNLKVTLVLRGNAADVALPHWNQTVSQKSGSVLYTTTAGTTGTVVDAVHGYCTCVGGPTIQQGYGGGTGNAWSNMLVVVTGIEVMSSTPNPTMGGFNFEGLLEAVILNSGYYVDAPPGPGNGSGGPTTMNYYIATPANFTNQLAHGLKMPTTNNNDLCIVDDWSNEGGWYGLTLGEHTHVRDMRAVYCGWGLMLDNTTGTPHSSKVDFASVEVCQNIMGVLGSGTYKIDIELLDVESVGYIWDSNSNMNGVINIAANEAPSKGVMASYGNGAWIGNWNATPTNGAGIRLINRDVIPGAVLTPPSVPAASTDAWNGYARDAAVTIQGGTGVSVSVDGNAAAIPTPCTVIVPTGKKYNLGAYTVAPTFKWVLL